MYAFGAFIQNVPYLVSYFNDDQLYFFQLSFFKEHFVLFLKIMHNLFLLFPCNFSYFVLE